MGDKVGFFANLPRIDMFATCQRCKHTKRLHVSSKANFQRNMKRKYKWVKSHGDWACLSCAEILVPNYKKRSRGSMSEWWTCKRKRAYLVIDLAVAEADKARERTKTTIVAYRCKYCNKYHVGHESKWCSNAIYKVRYKPMTEVQDNSTKEGYVNLDHYEGLTNQVLDLLNEERFNEIDSIVLRFAIPEKDGQFSILEIDTAGDDDGEEQEVVE